MPNIGPGELIMILLVALIVFGPRKLPELGKSLGAGLREFRKSTQGLKEELEGSLKETPTPPGPAPVQTIHTPGQLIPVPTAEVMPAQIVTPQPVTPQAVTPQAVTPAQQDEAQVS